MGTANFNINGTTQASDLVKITRDAIYGYSKVRYTNQQNDTLTRVGIASNGKDFINRSDIKFAVIAADDFTMAPTTVVNRLDGQAATQIPSSFAEAAQFKTATYDELAELEVTAIYHLPTIQLPAKTNYIGSFNYRAGYERKPAAIVVKPEGAFLLIGIQKKASFVGMEHDSQLITAEEETTEDSDFGSLV